MQDYLTIISYFSPSAVTLTKPHVRPLSCAARSGIRRIVSSCSQVDGHPLTQQGKSKWGERSLSIVKKRCFRYSYEQSSRSSQLPRRPIVSTNVISGTEKFPGISWWNANEIAFGNSRGILQQPSPYKIRSRVYKPACTSEQASWDPTAYSHSELQGGSLQWLVGPH